MTIPTAAHFNDVHDEDPAFVHAVSLLAALEEVAGHDRRADVLPFLGMARAELTDFGQRRPAHYVDVEVTGGLVAGLDAAEEGLTELLADSEQLQHTLRLDAALQLLRRGMGAAAAPAP